VSRYCLDPTGAVVFSLTTLFLPDISG
jgi:hypothetical protein